MMFDPNQQRDEALDRYTDAIATDATARLLARREKGRLVVMLAFYRDCPRSFVVLSYKPGNPSDVVSQHETLDEGLEALNQTFDELSTPQAVSIPVFEVQSVRCDDNGISYFTLDWDEVDRRLGYVSPSDDRRARDGGHYRGTMPPAPVGGAA